MSRRESVLAASWVHGRIISFNYGAKGAIRGVLIQTEKEIVQVNFSKATGAAISDDLETGAQVDLAAELESHGGGSHPIYRSTRIEPPTAAAAAKDARFAGVIERFNYNRRGKVNGYQLDDGTYIHVGARLAKQERARVGERVAATGKRCMGADTSVLASCVIEHLPRQAPAEHLVD